MDHMKQTSEPKTAVQNNIPIVTLSDSDSDTSYPFHMSIQQKSKVKKSRMCRRKLPLNVSVDLSSTILIEDSGESADEELVQKRLKDERSSPVDIIPPNVENKSYMKFNEIDGQETLSAEVNFNLPILSTISTSLDNANMDGNVSERNSANDTIILSDSPLKLTSISLSSRKEKEGIPNEKNDCDIFIDDLPRLIINEPKRLRPVAIDGSNIARAHGIVSNTFSCKGIKIAIDYFLERGHQEVIAFLPHFRSKKQQHYKFGSVLTTDQFLLQELEKEQHVVFTPSRCYDDRFIVEYATKTGGIIVSNDNYRDIAAESEEYRKTINERLLMFCFVGDIIMIPQDPLGRDGPSLDRFLSFST